MHKIIYLFLLVTSLNTFSNWEGCKPEVHSSLSTAREQYVLNSKSSLLTELGFDNCDERLYSNMVVAIHEGVHFIDLGFDSFLNMTDLQTEEVRSLYMIDMSRLRVPQITLPSPYDVLESDNTTWKLLFNNFEEETFSFDYKEYIEDEGMASSSNALYGLGTEFNAYAHGSLTAWNLRHKTNELKNEIPYMIVTQRTGLIFFMGIVSQYLKLIKSHYPELWSDLVLEELTTQYYGKLYNQAYEALISTRHCSKSLYIEADYLLFLNKTLDENILKDLNVGFNYEGLRQNISCI